MASSSSIEDKLRFVFDRLDKDGQGVLSHEEFVEGCRDLQIKLSEDDIGLFNTLA